MFPNFWFNNIYFCVVIFYVQRSKKNHAIWFIRTCVLDARLIFYSNSFIATIYFFPTFFFTMLEQLNKHKKHLKIQTVYCQGLCDENFLQKHKLLFYRIPIDNEVIKFFFFSFKSNAWGIAIHLNNKIELAIYDLSGPNWNNLTFDLLGIIKTLNKKIYYFLKGK